MRIGLVLNPAAGLGGPLAFKGSDGLTEAALARGAVSQVAGRAREALRAFAPAPAEWITGAGALGGDLLAELGLGARIVLVPVQEGTTADDTRRLARACIAAGADLLLFAGGDGTARDVLAAIGDAVPVVGIPAGVKMQSAVFGNSPTAAGRLAADFADGRRMHVEAREVMDLDENRLRAGHVEPRLHGYLRCPVDRLRLQGAKSRAAPDESAVVAALGAALAARIAEGGTHVLGPGSTLFAAKQALGIGGALLGVDVVRDGALVARDVSDSELAAALGTSPASLWVTCIGGQGHIFGRGNQQISLAVLRRIGRENIRIVATPAKLQSLRGAPLRVDTGSPEADAWLAGHMPVMTGPQDASVYRVSP